MMRVGVFSDTHGDLSRLSMALKEMGEIDAFLHLGDFGTDAEAIQKVVNVPFYAVRGNCDFVKKYPAEEIVELEGARLFLAHGDQFRDIYSLACRAEEAHCQMALYGHTHIPLFTAQGPLLILNPGSLTRPLGGSQPSCALLEIDQGEIHVRMIPLQL